MADLRNSAKDPVEVVSEKATEKEVAAHFFDQQTYKRKDVSLFSFPFNEVQNPCALSHGSISMSSQSLCKPSSTATVLR